MEGKEGNYGILPPPPCKAVSYECLDEPKLHVEYTIVNVVSEWFYKRLFKGRLEVAKRWVCRPVMTIVAVGPFVSMCHSRAV